MNSVPYSKLDRSRTKRGAALIAAIALTIIISFLIGAGLTYINAHHQNTWSKSNSETALLLAEAGINDEISFITTRLHYSDPNKRSSPPTTATGEPYPGRKDSLLDVRGNYWVYSSNDAAGTTAWDGKSTTFYITANALVNGAWRRVRIGGPGMLQSVFDLYAIFALDYSGNGNQAAVGLSSATVDITGTVGTNGRVTNNSSTLYFTNAIDFNTANVQPSTEFTNASPNGAKPIFYEQAPAQFPSCTDVLKNYFGTQAGATDIWTWLAANNDNDKIRTFASTNPALTPTGTVAAGFTKAQTILSNENKYKNNNALLHSGNGSQTDGSWTNANAGTDGIKAIILPPGDYYMTDLNLDYIANHKLIIDDSGLTVGGNTTLKQVRIWMNGTSGNDTVSMRLLQTSGTDTRFFRIYYNKPGETFMFSRDPGFPSGEYYNVYGCVYGVSTINASPITIKFDADTNSSWLRTVLTGSLVADRIAFHGYSWIYFTPNTNTNPNDPAGGVGYVGGYTDG